MDLQFRRLTPETVSDFLYFFDNDAFPKGDKWANCYCLEGHLEGESKISDPAVRREEAKKLVLSGKLTGYMILDGDRIIGWTKAGDKCDFTSPDDMPGMLSGNESYGEVKIIYCIDLIPEYRGKGIAKQILQKVIDDAQAEGYKYLEAYPDPFRDAKRNYRGHIGMYESFGFEAGREVESPWFSVMRKALCSQPE